MKKILVLLTLSLFWTVGVFADQTIYLIRHAEKVADGSRDPALTELGAKRAVTFSAYFQDRGLKAVYSSNYLRTRDTAAPTAQLLGHDIILYDAGNLQEIAAVVKARGDTVLVVGHSNTTAVLVNILAGTKLPDLEDHHYDRIYIVSIKDDGSKSVTIEHVEPLTP